MEKKLTRMTIIDYGIIILKFNITFYCFPGVYLQYISLSACNKSHIYTFPLVFIFGKCGISSECFKMNLKVPLLE